MILWTIIMIFATLFIAYVNGANDNFKGVATLFGSGVTNYRRALVWATFTTFLGSLTAITLATKLVKTFSGKGLLPNVVVENPVFLASVILGAGFAILIATRLGIPISTTHSLTGALVGSGVAAVGLSLNLGMLGKNFVLPLLTSPLIALTMTAVSYPLLRWVSLAVSLRKDTCVCVGEKIIPLGTLAFNPGTELSVAQWRSLGVVIDKTENCVAKSVQVYSGKWFGVEIQKMMDTLHYLSGGALSFARGLNDAPKIVSLSLAFGTFGLSVNIGLVAIAMAIGGLMGAHRVAETMSHRITTMSHGQGCAANIVSSCIVIAASYFGLPVSTTHVSCGSLFGIGLTNGCANWKMISGILSAWLLTLPGAALLSATSFLLLKGIH